MRRVSEIDDDEMREGAARAKKNITRVQVVVRHAQGTKGANSLEERQDYKPLWFDGDVTEIDCVRDVLERKDVR